MIIQFICSKCGRNFIPNPKGVEIKPITSTKVNMICPKCVEDDRKLWTVKNAEFTNKNYCSYVSFTTSDGIRQKDMRFVETATGIGIEQIPEHCRQHVSDQLMPLLVKHRQDRQKWQAKIEFMEEFESDYMKITCSALDETLIVKYRKREDGALWLDPKQSIPDKILLQINEAWIARQQQHYAE